jgi:hypothetical protein
MLLNETAQIEERQRALISLSALAHAGSSFADFLFSSTLNMKTIYSSETSVHTISTRRHIPEDGFLHSHRRENLESYILSIDHRNFGLERKSLNRTDNKWDDWACVDWQGKINLPGNMD